MVYFTLARCLAFAFIGTLLFWPGEIAAASAEVSITKGQTVYVPVYSNVYSGPRKRPAFSAKSTARNSATTNA